MNPSQKADLLLAILAMDSYNQGYDAGLDHGAKQIGSARIDTDSSVKLGETETKAVGFYAAAYDVGGTTVISYRGTDDLSLNPFGAGDIFTGWVSATGEQTGQTALAVDFYKAVTGETVYETSADNVTLTGHSLGGGLAGAVSWLSGKEALVFDHMPFGIVSAILAAENVDPITGQPHALATNKVRGENVINEILQSVRSGNLIAALTILPAPILNILGLYLGIEVNPLLPNLSVAEIAIKIAAYESLVPKTEIESYSGVGVSNLPARASKLHMMDYLVNLKFAEMQGNTGWHTIGEEFYEAYFNEQVGLQSGFTEAGVGGETAAAGKMGRAIAYSTLGYGTGETEGLVFGNSAAEAMFNDLDDLGKVYKSTSLDSILLDEINDGVIFDTSVKQALSNIAVQYAGALARYKVEVAKAAAAVQGLDVTKGVLATSADTTSIALDTSSILWKDVLKSSGSGQGGGDGNGGADNPGYQGNSKLPVIHEAELRSLLLAQTPNFQLSLLQWIIDIASGTMTRLKRH